MLQMLGKTVFITGTNRGLGKSLVETFAASGADVIAHARRSDEAFIRWCASVGERYGIAVRPVFFDMTDSASMKSEVRKIVSAGMPVKALVNNAGVAHGGLFQMTSLVKIREIFDVNLFAHMELTQQLLRYMIRGGGGSIVNISSISGIDLKPGNCAYGVSKAALAAFTKVLAAECAKDGVRVNAVCPGLTDTDMARQMEEGAYREMVARSALNRLAKPEEIARLVLYLASDDSSFVSGQVIVADGGRA